MTAEASAVLSTEGDNTLVRVTHAGTERTLVVLPSAAGEPLVRDLDLAAWLGFERPRDIRKIITRHVEAENITPTELRATVARSGGLRGTTTVTEYLLTMPDALFVATQSATPRAVAVTKEMIAVFLAARAALAPVPNAVPPWNASPPLSPPASPSLSPAAIKKRRQRARQAARRALGLPPGAPLPPGTVLPDLPLLRRGRPRLSAPEAPDPIATLERLCGQLMGLHSILVERFRTELATLAEEAAQHAGLGILGSVPASERQRLCARLLPYATAREEDVPTLVRRVVEAWLSTAPPVG